MWIEFNRIGHRFEYELRWLHVSPCSRKNTEKGHLQEALRRRCLPAGAAQKFAGRLSWSCQSMFSQTVKNDVATFLEAGVWDWRWACRAWFADCADVAASSPANGDY